MFISKNEINALLRNIYGIQQEKDFGIDSFLYVPNHGLELDTLKKAVKDIKDLDKIIEFKVSEEK
jgi:hypothetical protein